MKLIDTFIFYNELDLLRYRLAYLNEIVDYFVIVESTHTFVGHKKELFFDLHKEEFKEYSSKIIHVIVDDMPHIYPHIQIKKKFTYHAPQWKNEFWQRNQIARGIDMINNRYQTLDNEDLIIITDVDEIPSLDLLKRIKTGKMDVRNFEVKYNSLEMEQYCYNLTFKYDVTCRISKILTYEIYKEMESIQEVRANKIVPMIPNAGWHLSYFGDQNFVRNKLLNFSHQEFNHEKYVNTDEIMKRFTSGIFPLGDWQMNHVKISENSNLPPGYELHLTKFLGGNVSI